MSAAGQVKANALADGTYTVPVLSVKDDGTNAHSMAQGFLGDTGNVNVDNGTYEVSVPITSAAGQAALKSALVDGKSILDGSSLTFVLHDESPSVVVDYHVVVTVPGVTKPLVDKQVSAYETFDWSKVKNINVIDDSDKQEPEINSDSISSSLSDSSTSSSSSSSSKQSVINPGTDKITKLNYSVLQADKKSISAANQYYTHVANIEKLSDGSYKVTMHVQYGKNSGMSAKGFVPLTVNGQKVADVTYGSTDKDYTASFSFNVPSLDALTKSPVKGTIHVSVPTMDISSDFDIFYNFTGATTSDGTGTTNANNSSAAETPSNSSQTSAKASTTKKAAGKLPQTNDIQNATVAIVGVISLIMIVTTAVYRRNRV